MGLVDLKSSEKGIEGKMGFGGQKGTKYRRMDSEEEGEEEIHHSGERRREKGNNSRKYVYVCALFASLNSILLGYGEVFFSLFLVLILVVILSLNQKFKCRAVKSR